MPVRRRRSTGETRRTAARGAIRGDRSPRALFASCGARRLFARNAILGGFLVALAFAISADSDVEAAPYVARSADGERVAGDVTGWGTPGGAPRIGDRLLFDPKAPVRWLGQEVPVPVEPTGPFVELHGGDRLAGTIVAGRRGDESPFDRQPPHVLLVLPSESGLRTLRPAPRGAPGAIRVAVESLRRVVWEPGNGPRLPPGSLRGRDGRRLAFTAAKWTETALQVLHPGGLERIAYDRLAEVHLPTTEAWDALADQFVDLLATHRTDGRIVRLRTLGGAILTTSDERSRPESAGKPEDRAAWRHVIQPAWSLDPFAVQFAQVASWLFFAPDELPLTWLEPGGETRRAVFSQAFVRRTDRSTNGEPLRIGARTFLWGFGVHAEHRLEFPLPDAARAVRLALAPADDVPTGRGGMRAAVQFDGRPLFRSALLRGGDALVDPGDLALPATKGRAAATPLSSFSAEPPGEGAATGGAKANAARPTSAGRLALVAEMAHAERARGGDPFDVFDRLNWLEPVVRLEPVALRNDLLARYVRRAAESSGWKVSTAPGDPTRTAAIERPGTPPGPTWPLDLETTWDADAQRWITEAAPRGRLVYARRVRIDRESRWLVPLVERDPSRAQTGSVDVLVDGQLVDSLDVPPRRAGDDPDVPGTSLEEFVGREVELSVVHAAAGPRGFVAFGPPVLQAHRPGLKPVLEEEILHARLEPREAFGESAQKYVGTRALHLTPEQAVAELRFDTPVPIRRFPRLGEYRFLRYAWRKQGGTQLTLRVDGSQETSLALEPGQGSKGLAGTSAYPLTLPSGWQVVTRDLYSDTEGKPFDLQSLTFVLPDGEAAWFDHVHLARHLRDFDDCPLPDGAVRGGDLRVEPLRRGWGTEAHEDMVYEVAPGFNTYEPQRAVTLTLLSRCAGRDGVVETVAEHMLVGNVAVPANVSSKLHLQVARPAGDWKIAVSVDGKSLTTVPIDPTTAPDRWSDALVDLTPYAGRTVRIDLQCKGGAGYWRRIGVESR